MFYLLGNMLFNSIEYLIFFPAVVALYFAINHRWKWVLLLAASYLFYMSWKVEYVLLIMASTLVDYYAGLKMGALKQKAKRKKYLVLSLIVNLGILAGFKYFNFFSESINDLLRIFDSDHKSPLLNVLLPVGISFYTFQTISYSIDVYRGIKKPEKHLGIFALYVSFFPQLVAGPIERSNRLLPQFRQKKEFSPQLFVSGLKLMLWGFFKKIVIADRLGLYVSSVYDNPGEQAGLPIILATVLFAFQLYCDFSGYTDIARGSARVMGYDLMINFNRPLIAKSISEFWERWHISLTTWFRDYLYFSLPMKRKNKVQPWRMQLNVVITFLLMGLWHGANWTFIVFGLMHGMFLVAEQQTGDYRKKLSKITGLDKMPGFKNFISWLFTFFLLCFSIVFFRSGSLAESLMLLGNAFNFENISVSIHGILSNRELIFGILQIVILLMAERYHARNNLIKWIGEKPIWFRWSVYVAFVFYILVFGIINRQVFLYFQF